MINKKYYDEPELELELFTVDMDIVTFSTGQDAGDDIITDADGTPFQEWDIYENGIPNF